MRVVLGRRSTICSKVFRTRSFGARIRGISRRRKESNEVNRYGCLRRHARNGCTNRIALAYYPLLKAQQFQAARETVRLLAEVVERNSIRNLLVVPVSPWILSAALALHRRYPKLNLVFYVMDDWQGHHECHELPYSRWRRRLLREAIDRANTRFAVSREMAAHYEQTFGKSWAVVHNGVSRPRSQTEINGHRKPQTSAVGRRR